jgi:hypothetical protein
MTIGISLDDGHHPRTRRVAANKGKIVRESGKIDTDPGCPRHDTAHA